MAKSQPVKKVNGKRCGVKGCRREADHGFYIATRLLRCLRHQKNTATLKNIRRGMTT